MGSMYSSLFANALVLLWFQCPRADSFDPRDEVSLALQRCFHRDRGNAGRNLLALGVGCYAQAWYENEIDNADLATTMNSFGLFRVATVTSSPPINGRGTMHWIGALGRWWSLFTMRLPLLD